MEEIEPQVIELNKRPRKTIARHVFEWALCTSLFVTVMGFTDPNKYVLNQGGDGGVQLSVVGLMSVGMVLIWAFLYCYIRAVRRTARQAFGPVLSLAQIEAQLRAEGYNPTLQEVLAVDEYLRSERNQAAVLTGVLLLGPILARHHDL